MNPTVLPEPPLPQFSTASVPEFSHDEPLDKLHPSVDSHFVSDDETLVDDLAITIAASFGSPLDGLTEKSSNQPPPLPPRRRPSMINLKPTTQPTEQKEKDSTATRRASPENRPTYSLFPKDTQQDMRRKWSSPQVPLSSKKSTAFQLSTVIRRTPQARPTIGRLEIPHPQHQAEFQSISASLSDRSSPRDSIFTTTDPSMANTSTSPASDAFPGFRSRLSSPRAGFHQVDTTVCTNDLSPMPPLQTWNDLIRKNATSSDLYMIRKSKRSQERVAIAERVAATKIFFETYYDNTKFEALVTCGMVIKKAHSPRSLRRLKAEQALYLSGIQAEQQRAWLKHFSGEESSHLRHVRLLKTRRAIEGESVSAAGYETVRVLGRGSFGTVSLVRDHNHSTRLPPHLQQRRRPVYAMKVIKKADMLRSCQEAHLRAERDFLVGCIGANSRWVVPLVASFQDPTNLYLVMDFQVGGDFLHLLEGIAKGVLSEDYAKFYLAEMVLCIEETHKYKWIHRDVKPDNFLITSSGHLKISDFGLAFDGHWAHTQTYYNEHRLSLMDKLGVRIRGDQQDRQAASQQLTKTRSMPTITGPPGAVVSDTSEPVRRTPRLHHRKVARSIVGTSQYMAPEVIDGRLYDGRCDWWSIGIILYECLYGMTPFYREEREATKLAIVHFRQTFRFPDDGQPTTPAARELIRGLLSHRRDRLSAKYYKFNDFKYDASGRAMVYIPNEEKLAYDYAGRAVHPNDANAIKQHPFFHGIDWNNLHCMTPPFVPEVHRGEELTRYFESEEQILNDCSSVAESINPDVVLDDKTKERLEMKQQRKRPRDRLLRDPDFADTVMAERTKSAFWGYTWKRPTTWAFSDQLKTMFDVELEEV